MMRAAVCGVVITFHPKIDVLENLAKVRPQLQGMVIVDNGSSPQELAPFYEASARLGFTIIENGENLGIAAALNTGIRWAQSHDFSWVALFDQDSTVEAGLIEKMLAYYAEQPDQAKVAIVVPRYIDRKSGAEMPLLHDKDGKIMVVRTSGSLMPVSVFDHTGWFLEDFVIDQVDYEYCLRLGTLGYKIIACRQATLIHSLGERQRHRVLGLFNIITTHHNAKRRYYITRNRVRMIQLYWKQYPAYCLDLLALTAKDTFKILLVEKPRFTKMKNSVAGLRDALLNRMGKTVEL
ncbi:dTDP-rhamnosyl transferase RfbF [Acidisarcina polymorpha]|uniref:dTDP-rhamnosyl transferase RfbF n=1 Tax=Acidisarcina polymorpha TaxID=2211140 RepID=A0A2Z5G1I1_9BACT|nr:glycosyltransferase family 2 protein [Acidisarcina polymorpha]AXC12938.1 dTDP-rhamnosyl transferase RfbF [Acidisarcina polymorpha]